MNESGQRSPRASGRVAREGRRRPSTRRVALAGLLVDFMEEQTRRGGCGGPWRHEMTAVVNHCSVEVDDHDPVLLVNPTWLGDLVRRDELGVLADEMRTWYAIHNAVESAVGDETAPDLASASTGSRSAKGSRRAA
jgi:hypothetical protein